MGVIETLNKIIGRESEAEKLYKVLNTETYKARPYETEDLGDDMCVVNEAIWEY